MNWDGERLKSAREASGLTQEELGKKVDVTGVTIMRYEKNQRQPRLGQFQRIADALGVDVNWLMNGKTLEQRDQEMKDKVKRRFTEVELEKRLHENCEKLTLEGREKVADYAEDLSRVPEYQKGFLGTSKSKSET